MNVKSVLFTIILASVSVVVTLCFAEVALRIKNSDGKNYHVEMWKYSRDLKQRSDNPVLGHEHIPNRSAKLQNVEIRINDRGMRGEDFPPVEDGQRRIMFLGSSATLGWGIEERETMSAQLAEMFEEEGLNNVTVMNAGIGNYNAKRYVELFLTKNTDLQPTDIVVNYYINDAEVLEAGGGNVLIRNSELALTFWILVNRLMSQNESGHLYEHYKNIYTPDFQGYIDMKKSLEKLAVYAQKNGIRIYFMMMPEVHDLSNYKYNFIHTEMKQIAESLGYIYVDALNPLQQVDNTQSLWAMPGDPHPNALAHKIFAQTLYPVLKK